MSKRDQLADRARRLAAAPSAPTEVRTSVPTQVSTEAVRVNVDLPPVEHGRLRQFVVEAQTSTGRRRLGASDVLRVVLDMLHTDDELAARVLAELAAGGGQR